MRKIPSFLRRSHKLKACESSPVLVASSRKSESQAMTGASGRAMGGRHKSLGKIPGCSLVEETEEEEEEEEGGAPRSASPETKQMANPLALFKYSTGVSARPRNASHSEVVNPFAKAKKAAVAKRNIRASMVGGRKSDARLGTYSSSDSTRPGSLKMAPIDPDGQAWLKADGSYWVAGDTVLLEPAHEKVPYLARIIEIHSLPNEGGCRATLEGIDPKSIWREVPLHDGVRVLTAPCEQQLAAKAFSVMRGLAALGGDPSKPLKAGHASTAGLGWDTLVRLMPKNLWAPVLGVIVKDAVHASFRRGKHGLSSLIRHAEEVANGARRITEVGGSVSETEGELCLAVAVEKSKDAATWAADSGLPPAPPAVSVLQAASGGRGGRGGDGDSGVEAGVEVGGGEGGGGGSSSDDDDWASAGQSVVAGGGGQRGTSTLSEAEQVQGRTTRSDTVGAIFDEL